MSQTYLLPPKNNTPLMKITPPTTNLKPRTPTLSTTSDKSNTFFSSNNKKSSTLNPTANSSKPRNITSNNKDKTPQPNTTTNKPETCSLEYSVIEDMNKTKENISMYDIYTLPQQRNLVIDNFNTTKSQKKKNPTIDNGSKIAKTKAIHRVEIKDAINETSIGAYSRCQICPFLLTFSMSKDKCCPIIKYHKDYTIRQVRCKIQRRTKRCTNCTSFRPKGSSSD
jgi:rubrerythrin